MRRKGEIGVGLASQEGVRSQDQTKKGMKERAMKAGKVDGVELEGGAVIVEDDISNDWSEMQAGQLEANLGTGALLLETGIKDADGQVDAVAVEGRILELLKKKVDLSVLSESNAELAKNTMQEMLRDKEDFSTEEVSLMEQSLVDLGVGVGDVLKDAKQEMEDSQRAEIARSEAEGTAQVMEIGEAEAMNSEEVATFGTSKSEFSALIKRSAELGSPDVVHSSAADFEQSIAERDEIRTDVEKMQKDAGLFGRLFGKKAREIASLNAQLRELNATIRITQEFVSQNAGAVENVNVDVTNTSAASRIDRKRGVNRRQKQASGSGRMTG